ncbi:MAG TPA: hypothetical protein VMW52_05575 [Phycisphaerae bacterium]|nr:hypothetical protein [Phycisphaerae bacterium]
MIRTRTSEQILEALGDVLDLGIETIEQLGQAEPEYFSEARPALLKALRNWQDDQLVRFCLHCGGRRLEWLEAEAAWCCQDCGAIDEDAGKASRAA